MKGDTVTNLAEALAYAEYSLICEYSSGPWDTELREWAATTFDDDTVERAAIIAAVEHVLSNP